MKHDPIRVSKRKAVNLSLDSSVVDLAKEAGINMSQVSEAALRQAAQEALDQRWRAENKDWIIAHNKWVDENELPLERYRLF